MLNLETATKAALRAEMRNLNLPADGLNVEGLKSALAAHYALPAAEPEAPADEPAPEVAVEVPAVTVPEVSVPPVVLAPVVPVVLPAPKPARLEANGVKQPATGTICRQIWDYCDEVERLGQMPQAKALRAWGAGKLDDTTMTVQFYRWRKFKGYSGRQA